MNIHTELSNHEKHLLQDFLVRRPKYLSTINALISSVVILFLLWFFPNSFTPVIIASLSGTLIGVYFEQRHIAHLRTIFQKISRDILATKFEGRTEARE